MEKESKDMKKISWSFFWRLFLWNIAIMIPVMIILCTITGFSFTANLTDIDELLEYIKSYKPYVIGSMIIGFFTTIIAAKLATNGVLKKYEVTEENKSDVLKKVAVVLAVILCFSVWSSISTLRDISDAAEDYKAAVKNISKSRLDDKEKELLEEMDSFVSFSDKIVVVQVLCNAASVGLAYYLERKWILKK